MMADRNQLILTGSDDSNQTSFYIVDIEKKSIVYKKNKIHELESLPPEKGRPLFRPFGVTTDDRYIYLASNDKIGLFNKDSYDFIKCLDINAFVNTHQILIENDILFVCHTAINCIGIHYLTTKENKFLKLPDCKFIDTLPSVNYVDEYDTVHINSLYLHDSKLYFCLHYRNQRKSRYGYFDMNNHSVTYFFDGGFCSHNIRIVDNILYSLSTKEGCLIEFDLNTKQTNYHMLVDPKKFFLRGLEKYKNGLIYCGSKLYTEDVQEYFVQPFIGYFDRQSKTTELICNLPEPKFITDICWE